MKALTQRSYYWLFLSLALVGFMADQASKYAVFTRLYDAELHKGDYAIIEGLFHFQVYYKNEKAEGLLRTWNAELMPGVNTGALWGSGREWAYGNLGFAVVSALAAGAILYWSSRPGVRTDLVLCIALGLILAGTLGNLYDRLVFEGVRDFLHWQYGTFVWPTFNLADCCLVCGAGLLLGHAFFTKEETPTDDANASPAALPTTTTPGG